MSATVCRPRALPPEPTGSRAAIRKKPAPGGTGSAYCSARAGSGSERGGAEGGTRATPPSIGAQAQVNGKATSYPLAGLNR